MSECVTLSSVRESGPLTVTGVSGDEASALGQAVVAGPGGAVEVDAGVLAGALRVAADADAVAAGLAAAGHGDRRRRVFTGLATVVTILGLCLLRREGYDLVIGRTLAAVPRVRVEGNPSGAALSKARRRLAGDAMRLVFEHAAAAMPDPGAEGYAFGLLVTAFDGTVFDLAATAEIGAVFATL